MPFNFLRLGGNAVNKVAGRTDLLEAGGAIGALVASGDGSISEDEVKATVQAIKTNEVVNKAFSPQQIEKEVLRQFDKADGGTFSGKRALWLEIDQVLAKNNDGDGEILLMIGADVAMKGGGIEEGERKVLDMLCKKASLNLADYGI